MTVAKRLEPYIQAPTATPSPAPVTVDRASRPKLDELAQRAATFVAVMPPHQRRSTIESLVSPGDPERGRRAVAELIDHALVAEDERGYLRLLR